MSNFIDDQYMNSHDGLSNPAEETSIIKGDYRYYHYNCDGFNDSGWGCGYRTTQTLCSWIRFQKLEQNKRLNIEANVANVPTILEIQKILVDCGDKTSNFIGSKQWIGSFESSIVIDTLYDVPCKILHCEQYKLKNYLNTIWMHFETIGSPLMMGGDLDNESKCILGISKNDKIFYFLIADPHCRLNEPTKQILYNDKWISWENATLFDNGSFYNFCLPQLKAIKG